METKNDADVIAKDTALDKYGLWDKRNWGIQLG